MAELNSECLSHLHPTVATLSYLVATGRIRNKDRLLSYQLIESKDWDSLDGDQRQFVRMVDGANLSDEARDMTIDFLQDFIPVKEACHEPLQSPDG